MSRSRVVATVLCFAALAGACGAGSPSAPGAARAAVEAAPVPSTVPSTMSSAVPTTTTTTVAPTPPDPFETFVATVRPEITVLDGFVEPDGDPAVFEYAITNPTYFGNPLRLMITDRTDDGDWLKVQVPVRPNGTEAWIRAADAEVSSHRFRARIDLTDRAVTVWDGTDVVAQTAAVIGKDSTPTPLGRFFVNDLVEKWEGSSYGPFILSLSAFSEALETFAGGIPVIAIHGTNRPELLGGAHSNGCIRIPNDIVTVLAETVPIGTPVDIVA